MKWERIKLDWISVSPLSSCGICKAKSSKRSGGKDGSSPPAQPPINTELSCQRAPTFDHRSAFLLCWFSQMWGWSKAAVAWTLPRAHLDTSQEGNQEEERMMDGEAVGQWKGSTGITFQAPPRQKLRHGYMLLPSVFPLLPATLLPFELSSRHSKALPDPVYTARHLCNWTLPMLFDLQFNLNYQLLQAFFKCYKGGSKCMQTGRLVVGWLILPPFSMHSAQIWMGVTQVVYVYLHDTILFIRKSWMITIHVHAKRVGCWIPLHQDTPSSALSQRYREGGWVAPTYLQSLLSCMNYL